MEEQRVPALIRSGNPPPAPTETPNEDLAKIKQAWLNERGAPELLPFEAEVFERIKQQIEIQEGNIQLSNDQRERLKAHIYWMEVNRFKYLLAAYSRARLDKITRYVDFILQEPEVKARLSASEKRFAKKYKKAVKKHFDTCFLQKIPEVFRDLSGEDTVAVPNFDGNVFIRVKEDVGDYVPPDNPDALLHLEKDDIYVLQYSSIRDLLLKGKIDLI